jgi:hypothetical protein
MGVVGAQRYRNPDDVLPADFADQRPASSQTLDQPLAPDAFRATLPHQMQQALQTLDRGMPSPAGGKLLPRPQGWIRVTPLARLPEPPHLAQRNPDITRRWPMPGLLDGLKETE